jgi:demethoxyubiquinone hydroxylase (CLK1/Coq7/Cat5 family)
MTSINIQTANSSVIDAIKAISALDPETTIITYDEPSLSEADQKELEEIIAADDRGEIKYISFEEFDYNMKDFLKSLGA